MHEPTVDKAVYDVQLLKHLHKRSTWFSAELWQDQPELYLADGPPAAAEKRKLKATFWLLIRALRLLNGRVSIRDDTDGFDWRLIGYLDEDLFDYVTDDQGEEDKETNGKCLEIVGSRASFSLRLGMLHYIERCCRSDYHNMQAYDIRNTARFDAGDPRAWDESLSYRLLCGPNGDGALYGTEIASQVTQLRERWLCGACRRLPLRYSKSLYQPQSLLHRLPLVLQEMIQDFVFGVRSKM